MLVTPKIASDLKEREKLATDLKIRLHYDRIFTYAKFFRMCIEMYLERDHDFLIALEKSKEKHTKENEELRKIPLKESEKSLEIEPLFDSMEIEELYDVLEENLDPEYFND